MRIIYFDIDTMRADHLGCYGYPRATTPRMDAVAAEGIRFDNTYASDTPCLPSRTALSSAQPGFCASNGRSDKVRCWEKPQQAMKRTSWLQ